MSGTATTERYGLRAGAPALSSAGALAFGPEGILFVADYAAAAVHAFDLGDAAGQAPPWQDVEQLDARLASLLGVERDELRINGLAVQEGSEAAYLSVTRGRGDAAIPVLVRVAGGQVAEVELSGVPFARLELADAPAEDDERYDGTLRPVPDADTVTREYVGVELHTARAPLRHAAITDLAWIDGALLVAGASNEEFVATLRRIPFPFTGEVASTGLEIYHVGRGRYETHAPVRALLPFDGGRSVLTSFICTPIVHFPLDALQPGAHATGRSVAELGQANQPLDMISYRAGDEEFLLVSGSRLPLYRLPAAALARQEPLLAPHEPGAPREELPQQGVSLMARLGADRVLLLQRGADGAQALRGHATAGL